MTAVADSPEEADELHARFLRVLVEEAAASWTPVTPRP
jgi:hypothetical protein